MNEESHFLEAPILKKISIAFILVYLAAQIYFELPSLTLHLAPGLYLKVYDALPGIVYTAMPYVTGTLLALSGFLLLGSSKYDKGQYKKVSAILLIVLGLYQTSIDIIYNNYWFDYLVILTFLHGIDTTVSGLLAALTFIFLDKSLSRKHAKPLIYLGSILLLFFASISAYSMVEVYRNIQIFGSVYFGEIFIYAGWVPWFLYFLGFMFNPGENKGNYSLEKEKSPEQRESKQETTVVFEK